MRSYKGSGSGFGWYLFGAVYLLICVGIALHSGWRDGLWCFVAPPLALIIFILGNFLIAAAVFLIVCVPYFLLMYGVATGLEKIQNFLKRIFHHFK